MQHKQHHRQAAAAATSPRLLLLASLLLLAPALGASAYPHSYGYRQQPLRRRLLQMAYPTQQQQQQPYNGSAVLATYPSLNSTGASLRQLLPNTSGYVNKSGLAEMLHWSQKPHYAIAREAVFLDWRQRELTNPAPQLYAGQGVTCAAARHPPAPFHHCHVFVNHEYKIAYIRSPKSASTSIMNWLGQCRYNKTRNWNSTTCMNYSWEQYHNPEQIASIWKDYFFFGFIRNPWARAYSLYKDMTGTNHFLQKHGPRCQLEWGTFCRDPFGEFDRVYGSGCSHKQPHYAYWHMMDQYHCMMTPTGGWAVDFLGRVEKGNEDWRVVVDEMNKRRLPGVPEVPYSALDHKHKVDLDTNSSSSSSSSGRSAGSVEQQQHARHHTQQQQQQQPHPQAQPPQRQLLGDAAQQQQQQQQQPFEMLRLFRHLWRRIRVGAAAANEDDSEADGEVDDFAGGSGGLAAADSGYSQNPDKDGSSGPYSGANEHCVDAVSQWFACDIDRFGYLPRAEAAAAEAEPAAAAAADATQPAAAAATATAVLGGQLTAGSGAAAAAAPSVAAGDAVAGVTTQGPSPQPKAVVVHEQM